MNGLIEEESHAWKRSYQYAICTVSVMFDRVVKYLLNQYGIQSVHQFKFAT